MATRAGNFRTALNRFVKPHVLVVDEVGYLAYGNDAANVLFHVVGERHMDRRSMIFTTNKNPKRWGPVLHDDDLAEAIVDRILERGRLLKLDGPSIRTHHLPELETANDEPNDLDPSRRVSGTEAAEFPEPTQPFTGISRGAGALIEQCCGLCDRTAAGDAAPIESLSLGASHARA